MQFGGPSFVIAIIALSMAAWVIITFIKAKHGYPISDDSGNPVHPIRRDTDETRALSEENRALKETVSRLEERLKVLERIATDPSRKLADDIEKLR